MVVLIACAPLLSAGEVERLRALVAEQEMQIQQLELKISQLTHSPAPAAPATAPAAIPPATSEIKTEPAPSNDSTTYTVMAGDNMVSIARKHGTKSAILNELNGLKSDDVIRPGQKLKIPKSAATTQTAVTETRPATAQTEVEASDTLKHTVAENETFYSIAKKYDVTIDALIKENPSINPKTLRIGKIVQIPAKSKTTDSSPVPSPAQEPNATGQSSIPVSNQSAPVTQPRASDKPVKITKEISYRDFAEAHNTTTTRLDEINGLRLDPTTILAQGSELYIPE
jgi:LysM repeat protein